MRILFPKIVFIMCITVFILSTMIALQAADIQNVRLPSQEPGAEWAGIPCLQNDGFQNACGRCLAERTNITWFGFFHHPTAIYHPQIYNYRYFFNIVGHETNYRPPNYWCSFPAANPPEKILTPLPEQQGRLSPAAGSARLSGPEQKKFQK